MDERWTYDSLRWSTLKAMYEGRRNILRDKRAWLHPIEDVGYAYHDDTPDEDLPLMPDLHRIMSETIYLILCAGLSPEVGFNKATEVIKSILAKTTIEELVKNIPENEARDLRYDLEILGFIPPDITKPQWG